MITYLFTIFLNYLFFINDTTRIDESNGLSDDSYNSFIYKDIRGNLWISTLDGYQIYNGIHFKKLIFENSENLVQSLPIMDKYGNFWYSTYSSLVNYNSKTKRLSKHLIPQLSGYHLFHYDIRKHILYLSISDNLYLFDAKENKFTNLNTPTTGKRFMVLNDTLIIASPWLNNSGLELISLRLPNNISSNKYIDSKYVFSKTLIDGNKLYALSNSGLFKLDSLIEFKKLNDLEIWDAIPIGSNNFLCTTRNEGMKIINAHEINNNLIKEQFKNSNFREIYLDRDSMIWINDLGRGVVGMNLTKEYFKLSNTNSSTNFLRDYPNKIQIINKFKKNSNVDIGTIIYLDALPNRKYLIAGSRGLYLYNDNSVSITKLSSSQIIRSIVKVNSRYYYSTESGLYYLNMERSTSSKVIDENYKLRRLYRFGDKIINSNHNGWVELITLNKHYTITIDSIKIKQQIFGFVSHKNVGHIITEDSIHCVQQNGKVLYSFKHNLSFNDEIEALQHKHVLWLGSNQGLFTVDLSTGETRAWTTREGLPSNNFSPNAALKTDDGRLWFGTDKGLVVFHPDSISFDFCTPRMNIEEILVNNQYIQSDTYVGDMTEATLAYDENSLAIRGVAIDCMFSPDVKSYYRFTGVDTTWKEVKNGDYLRYDRLDPGDYKLEMYALSPNLVKSAIKAIDFTINQPYWKTVWFRLLALLGIGGLAYGGIQLYVWNRLREERQKRLQLETQQAERNRIADELHDDLGGGLSVIRFLSEELQDSPVDQKTKTIVDKISSSSQQLLTSMREVIWAMDTRNDTLERLGEQIEDYATAYLSQRSIQLKATSNWTQDTTVITGEKRRNIYLICKEVIHNIAKHAEATSVSLQLTIQHDTLSIEIIDDGKGYDETKVKPGRGTGSMQRRAQAIGAQLFIQSKESIGTEIKLRYTLS